MDWAKKSPALQRSAGQLAVCLPSHQSGQQRVGRYQKLWRTPTAKELKSLPGADTP